MGGVSCLERIYNMIKKYRGDTWGVMKPFYFADKKMGINSALEMLSERSHYYESSRNIKNTAKLINFFSAKNYPLSENGTLEFSKVYQTESEKTVYFSPNYRIKKERINNINVPDIRLRWKAGDIAVIDESQEVATLEVTIESHDKEGYKTLQHDLSCDFVYSVIAEDTETAISEVSIPFDQLIDFENGTYQASMTIYGTENLGLIVTAMTKKECSANIKITAEAKMLLPNVQYSVDLNTYYAPELHKKLVNKGLVAESIVNNAKFRKIKAEPINRREPIKVPLTTISRVSSINPASTLDTGGRGLRRDGNGVHRIYDSRLVSTPLLVSRPVFIPTVVTTQPVTTVEPAITAEPVAVVQPVMIVKPIVMFPSLISTPQIAVSGLSAINSIDYGSFLKASALSEEGLDQKDITEAFKSSNYLVAGKKALQLIHYKDLSGRKMSVVKKLSASKKIKAFYSTQNYGQIYEDIPDHIMDSILGVDQDPTVLLAYNLTVGNELKVLYQSPQQQNLFYFTPETFKLGRADSPPYEPLMKIGFKELLLESEGESANIDYRVEVSFTALPDIEQGLYEAARTDPLLSEIAGGGIVLAPLNTGSATLNLDAFIADYNAEITAQDVSTDAGIMVSFEIGSENMDKLYAELLPKTAPGIHGYVRSNLSSGGSVDVALNVSLHDTVGAIFSQQFYRNETDAAGTYRVLLTNEIESEVSVKSARPWIISSDGSGVTGTIQSGSFDVPSGSSQDMIVQVTPSDALVSAIEIDTEHSVVSDDEVLWNLLTINNGLSFYAYEIEVTAADASLFGTAPSESVGPLTALKIEFKEGADALISAETSTTRAILYKSILADLQDKPLTEIYNYRIINMHGEEEGARGNWIEAQGTLHAYPVTPVSS